MPTETRFWCIKFSNFCIKITCHHDRVFALRTRMANLWKSAYVEMTSKLSVTQLTSRTLPTLGVLRHRLVLARIWSERVTSAGLLLHHSDPLELLGLLRCATSCITLSELWISVLLMQELIVSAKKVCKRMRTLRDPRFKSWWHLRKCELPDWKSLTTPFDNEPLQARGTLPGVMQVGRRGKQTVGERTLVKKDRVP